MRHDVEWVPYCLYDADQSGMSSFSFSVVLIPPSSPIPPLLAGLCLSSHLIAAVALVRRRGEQQPTHKQAGMGFGAIHVL